jgi:hypothetical protein
MVIFAYEEAGITTTFLESYEACHKKHQARARASADATPVWTTREWIESDGPSLAIIDWAETLRFYVDMTAQVFLLHGANRQAPGAEIGPRSLFRFGGANADIPYITYQPAGGLAQRLNVNAAATVVQEFVRNCGDGAAVVNDWVARLNGTLMALGSERAEEMMNRLIDAELDASASAETAAVKALRVYWAKIRRAAFAQKLIQLEQELLQGQEYAWLRV